MKFKPGDIIIRKSDNSVLQILKFYRQSSKFGAGYYDILWLSGYGNNPFAFFDRFNGACLYYYQWKMLSGKR
jgi:hypothetical protein